MQCLQDGFRTIRSECMDSTETASCVNKAETKAKKANSSSKHRTTYDAVVISGASKWVKDGEGEKKKTQQVGI